MYLKLCNFSLSLFVGEIWANTYQKEQPTVYYSVFCLLPHQNGSTPLSIAAERGHTEVIRKLLKAGASTQLQPQVYIPPLLSRHCSHLAFIS